MDMYKKLLFIILLTNNYSLVFSQTFSESSNTLIEGQFANYEFADIDLDGDKDLLSITTDITSSINLYINDGLGNFSLDVVNNFPPYLYANASFADVDADNDLDLILTGSDASNNTFTKLYLNDGFGVFTEDLTSAFNGATNGDVDFADVDSDGDMDVLISGLSSFADFRTRLYLNNGLGVFTMQSPFVFENTQGSENIFADFNSDGFVDVFQTGRNNNNDLIAKIFSNDGNGNFTEVAGTLFQPIELGDIGVSDIDNDGDLDIVLTGGLLEFTLYTKLYRNDGNFNFVEIPNSGLQPLNFSDLCFVDVDNDNDEDLLLCGIDSVSQRQTLLYVNDGNGNFTLATNLPFDGINYGDIKSSDIDGDGDKDVVIGGLKDPNSVDRYSNKIYINQLNTLSTSDLEVHPDVKIYFQKENRQIKVISSSEVNQLKLYNLNGNLVKDSSNNSFINTESITSGFYVLKVKTTTNESTHKIIIY